jgi:hypothetical protein
MTTTSGQINFGRFFFSKHLGTKFHPPSLLNLDFLDTLLLMIHGHSPSLPHCSMSMMNMAVLDNRQIEVFQEENLQFVSSLEVQTPIMAQAVANNTGALSSSSSDSSFMAGSQQILDLASHGGQGAEMGNKKGKSRTQQKRTRREEGEVVQRIESRVA